MKSIRTRGAYLSLGFDFLGKFFARLVLHAVFDCICHCRSNLMDLVMLAYPCSILGLTTYSSPKASNFPANRVLYLSGPALYHSLLLHLRFLILDPLRSSLGDRRKAKGGTDLLRLLNGSLDYVSIGSCQSKLCDVPLLSSPRSSVFLLVTGPAFHLRPPPLVPQ